MNNINKYRWILVFCITPVIISFINITTWLPLTNFIGSFLFITILATYERLSWKQQKQQKIEYQKTLEENQKLADRFRFAVGAGNIGVWEYDIINNALIWDKQMFDVYGVDPHLFENNLQSWEDILYPEDKEKAQKEFHDAIIGAKPYNTEFRIIKPKTGTVCCIRTHAIVKYNNAEPKTILGVNMDITEEKNLLLHLEQKSKELAELNKKLEKQAYFDSLTGLMNRHSFEESALRLLSHAKRNNYKLVCLFIDIDYFKTINDRFGHQIGDSVLIEICHRIRGILRKEDLLARFGGDELVAMIELNCTENAIVIVNKIMHEVAPPIHANTNKITVTVSIGISMFPDHGSQLEDLLNKADIALLSAKNHGRNKFETFS